MATQCTSTRLAASIALLLSLLLGSTLVHSETLTIATGDWPPYVSPQLKHYGVTARIVKEAFEMSGDKVVFQFFPWKRAMLMSEKGLLDGTFPWSHKPEWATHHYYSQAIDENGYVFFYLKSRRFNWQTLKDLRNLTIGGTNSYNYGKEFLDTSKNGIYSIEWIHSDELNWHKLMAGRIDLFPNDVAVGYAQLYDLFPSEQVNKITHHPLPLKPLTNLHILFSKADPEALERQQRFDIALQQLKESGKYEQYHRESREGKYRLVSKEIQEQGL